MASLIVENINTTIDPMYNPIFLKAGLAKIFKILNKTTCHIDDKLLICFDSGSSLDPVVLPTKYSAKINVQYDLNWLADQDGEIEDHCTNAFVNKITLMENLSFNECAEDNIDVDDVISRILDEIESTNFIQTTEQVGNAIDVVRLFLAAPQRIVNINDMRYMDENSGQYNINRRITHDLHQSTVISLNGADAYVIDTFSIEMDKNDAFGQITLAIKAVSIEVLIEEETDNPVNIDVSTVCNDI